jgi:hypothetical protein
VRALIAMVVRYPVGLCIGLVCQHVVEKHVQSRPGAHAVAETESAGSPNAQNTASAKEAEDVMVV